MKNAKPITKELISEYRKGYEEDKAAGIYAAALSRSKFEDVTFSPLDAAKLQNHFSIDLHATSVMDQKSSGRCWLFASMNIMRERVAKKCNMERFELSNAYISFWDKIEKINYFLEAAVDSSDIPAGERVVDFLMDGMGDGGQWDMMVSIVKKYGVVPQEVMPDNAQMTGTHRHMALINSRLRKDMIELRRMKAEGKDTESRKNEMLASYFKALCILYGEPPKTFDFTYEDKDKEFHADRGLTPNEFYEKYVELDLGDYVSLINSPTGDKPFGRSYTVKYLGSAVEGEVKYLNLPIEEIERLAVEQMKSGEPVWFGSDCGKYGNSKTGIWDPDSYTAEAMLGLDTWMSKADRLDFGDSRMNHAMVLTGVNIGPDGLPDRWKIENSWGEDSGIKGYFIGSAKWFREFVYQIVINRKFLTDEQIAAYEADPILLQPWDPMGALAE